MKGKIRPRVRTSRILASQEDSRVRDERGSGSQSLVRGTEHLLLGVLREERECCSGAQRCWDHARTAPRGGPSPLGESNALPVTPVRPSPYGDRCIQMRLISYSHSRSRSSNSIGALWDISRFLEPSIPERARIVHSLVKGLRYEKLADGYALDVVRPNGEKPELSYPPDSGKVSGFDAATSIAPAPDVYDRPAVAAYFDQLRRRMAALR